ncbi:MAG: hypothetical protein IJ870_03970 [Alphaproteobacteria bacterium]|nr:hypothetical protein [Alphaproteobacteria bacterium]
MEEKKLTTVFFQDTEGQWLKNQIDLKALQMKLPLVDTKSVKWPDVFVCEMMFNIFELVRQKHISFGSSLIITDIMGGKSNAANKVGCFWVANVDGFEVMLENGRTFDEVIDYALGELKDYNNVKMKLAEQITCYDYGKTVEVQNSDESIKAYAAPLLKKADIVFCNGLLAHTPAEDIPAVLDKIKNAGKYVFMTIPLRPSVGCVLLKEKELFNGAEVANQVPRGAVVLEKNEDGNYILPAHVLVLDQKQWQQLLGEEWVLLPSTDCTAVLAVNFTPSAEYVEQKKRIIAKYGFADFAPFPTLVKTPAEKNPILLRRTAAIQPLKHVMKLEALEAYPQSDFKARETSKSKALLEFAGLKPNSSGIYQLEDIPKDGINKLLDAEAKAKSCLLEKPKNADQKVAENFAELIGV